MFKSVRKHLQPIGDHPLTDTLLLHIAWKYKPSQPIWDHPLWPCPFRVVSNFARHSYTLIGLYDAAFLFSCQNRNYSTPRCFPQDVIFWLVVWNIFPYFLNNNPNWRTHIFFRGVGWNHQPVFFALSVEKHHLVGGFKHQCYFPFHIFWLIKHGFPPSLISNINYLFSIILVYG